MVVGYGTSAPPPDSERQKAMFLRRFPHLHSQRIFLFLGRIHPKKGIDLLIEAFSAVCVRYPTLHLVIAGPDHVRYQSVLQERIAALGLSERITWTGMLTGETKWGAFRCAELFCLPSHQENFAIVVAEALACGLPVAIAHPVNTSADVAAASAGIVHEDTIAGTKSALQKWLVMPPDERRSMGHKGLQLFNDNFDFSAVAKNLLPLMKKTC